MIFRFVLGCFFGAFITGVALVTHWTTYRDSPVTFENAVAINSPVQRGSDLLVNYRVDRKKSCAVTVNRIVADANGLFHFLPDLDFSAAVGPLGHHDVQVVVPIPRFANPGPASYRMTFGFRCNPVHVLWPITAQLDVPFLIAE